jgi:iron complex outermembrane recepter protein
LASSSPATALNLFNPGASAPGVLESIGLTRHFIYEVTTALGGGYVQGPLLSLPAGDLQVVVGGELQRDTFLRNSSTFSSAYRRSKAAFGELSIPILTDSIVGSLSFNAAVRVTDYSDFGQRYMPQYSGQWTIIPDVALRASFGKSFRAPQLLQLFQGSTMAPQAAGNFFDPLFKGATYTYTALTGGNRDLQPELGRSYAFGATWKRADWLGMELGVTYFRTQESNRIVGPGSFIQALVNDPNLIPGRVIRDATGRVSLIDVRFANFGAIDAAGVDIDLSFRVPTSIGDFRPSVSISRFTKYMAALTPTTGLVDRLSKASNSDVWAPRTRGTLGVLWSYDAYRANLLTRYVGHYSDYPGANNLTRTIGGYAFVDGSFEIDLSKFAMFDRVPGKSYVRFTASNLLDKKPTYSNYLGGSLGYDPLQDDIVGRLLGMTVGLRF